MVERRVLTALVSLFFKKLAATAIYVAYAWVRYAWLPALRRSKQRRSLNSTAKRSTARNRGLHFRRERQEPFL